MAAPLLTVGCYDDSAGWMYLTSVAGCDADANHPDASLVQPPGPAWALAGRRQFIDAPSEIISGLAGARVGFTGGAKTGPATIDWNSVSRRG